ncbi:MAG: type VI secretion system tube protein TssD [Promethearchaeota archaeon]
MKTSKFLKICIAMGIILATASSFLYITMNEQPAGASETSINAGSAGLNFYVWITGSSQGDIDGSVTISGREGSIAGHQYFHSIYVPIDSQSGLPTSRRTHTPVTILKEVDQATPKLLQALTTGETLVRVIIRFYRLDSSSIEVNYYTVVLDNAMIISIREFMPNNKNPETYQPLMEEISFVYERITCTWEEGGIEWQDNCRDSST